jgi:hypothetical protein
LNVIHPKIAKDCEGVGEYFQQLLGPNEELSDNNFVA